MDYDIVIIGAGAAGLIASYELCETNKSIAIIEGRDRIGGRIHTLKNSPFTRHVEIGAEFIHGELPITEKIIKEAGLKSVAAHGKNWTLRNGELTQEDMSSKEWDDMIIKMKKLKHDMTMANFFDIHLFDPMYESLRKMVTSFVQGYDAADINKVSTFALRDEWAKEDEFEQYRLDSGYSALIDFIYGKIKDHTHLYLSTMVNEIRWNAGGVEVFSSNGQKIKASKVLVTVPIGVLQKGCVRFVPELPEYNEAVKKIGFGSVIKFLFEFKTPFWNSGVCLRQLHDLNFLFSDAEIPTWWTQAPEVSSLLTGWLGGPAVDQFHLSESELRSKAMHILSNLLQCSVKSISNQCKAFHVANWSLDPFAYGAYAYATVETPSARKILSTPVAETIYFAGEALYEGPEMGTVEAALASGKNAAVQMRSNQIIVR